MKKPEIAVIDYSMGNLRSVGKALELVGADVVVSGDPARIRAAQAAVFPGVGSFGAAVRYLRKQGLKDTIAEVIERGSPFLGLCLGFQLLFDTSEEEGMHDGLGIIPGKVVRFDFKGKNAGLKVPHMGWNRVQAANSGIKKKMFKGIPDGSWFYFVHSYYGKPESRKAVAATTEYGIPFCSAVVIGNAWACQFHPEKSGANGLKLLKNFVEEVKKCS